MYSAAATGILDRRSSSRCASFLTVSGIPDVFDLLLKLLDLLGLVVALAQLLLNRLQLFAEEVFALVLPDFRLHLRLNLRAELEDLELLDQDPIERVHTRAHIERLEHFLFDRGGDGRQARGDEIGETAGLADVRRQRLQIVGQQRRQRHDLLEIRLDVTQQRVDLQTIVVTERLDGRRDPRAQIGLRFLDLVQPKPFEALHDQPQAAVRQLEHLVNQTGGSDLVQVGLLRLLDGRIPLREDADQFALRDGFVDQTNRAFARHRERHEGIRKQDGVAEGQDRQLIRNRDRTIAGGQFFQIQRLVAFGHGGNPLLIEDVPVKGYACEAIRRNKNSQPPITGSGQERALEVGSSIRRLAGAKERR